MSHALLFTRQDLPLVVWHGDWDGRDWGGKPSASSDCDRHAMTSRVTGKVITIATFNKHKAYTGKYLPAI